MQSPQVVLYVENGLIGGGSAESLLQLLTVLDREKFHPIVVFTTETPYVARVAATGVETIVLDHWYVSWPSGRLRFMAAKFASIVVVYGARWLPRLSLWLELAITANLRRRLGEVIRNRQVSLVHTNNNVHRDLWAIAAASECGIPCVSHLRSFHSLGFSTPRADYINQRVVAYIAYSRSMAQYWIEAGLDFAKIDVIHNAIGPLSLEPTNLEREFGISASSQVLAIVGLIIPERRHELLIRALQKILLTYPSARLLIVGRAAQHEDRSLRQLVDDLGLADAVVFAGYRRDAREIIAAVDVLVLPYSIEPFGRTVLEAWQLGTPVVLSRVGHVAEIVEDNETALLFESDNVDELADRIVELFSDAKLADRLARQGHAACQRRFSIKAQRAAIQALYLRVLNLVGKAVR